MVLFLVCRGASLLYRVSTTIFLIVAWKSGQFLWTKEIGSVSSTFSIYVMALTLLFLS